jgi:hypothetical protein
VEVVGVAPVLNLVEVVADLKVLQEPAEPELL